MLFNEIFNDNISYTENNGLALKSTLDARVDLFFKLCRDLLNNKELFNNLLYNSWNNISTDGTNSKLDTLKIIYNTRDCRGGKGEKDLFIYSIKWLYLIDKNIIIKNLKLIPEYGSWLDIIKLLGYNEELDIYLYLLIDNQLRNDYNNMNINKNVSLLAKWIPSEHSKFNKSINITYNIAKNISNKDINLIKKNSILREFRIKYITPLRKHIVITENLMCSNQWDNIIYENVPSRCMLKNKKIFLKKSKKFLLYLDNLIKNKVKINYKHVFPHELVSYYLNNNEYDEIIESQWRTISNTIKENNIFEGSIPICDVSSSMTGIPMQVCIALGLLISENTSNDFKNLVITFSKDPSFVKINENDTLKDKIQKLKNIDWNMNTDLNKCLNKILEKAIYNNISNKNMIKKIFIFSDMQFDDSNSSNIHIDYNNPALSEINNKSWNTQHEILEQKFHDAGYDIPHIIYWNLRGNTMNVPVDNKKNGVSLMSGFSIDILKLIMNGDIATPYKTLRLILDSERYSKLIL